MPVPAALSETSMAAAPGAPWNACTGFCLSSVIPVSSKRGRSGKFWMSAARTRSSSITNWENMTTLWPLPTVSASFSMSRLIFPESERLLPHRGAHVVPQPLEPLGADPGVFNALDVSERADEVHLDLRRQLLRDLALRPAQDERSQLRPRRVGSEW